MRGRRTALMVVTFVSASCGALEQKVVDIPVVEQDIEDLAERENPGIDVTVTCPDEVDWETGSYFRCMMHVPTGEFQDTEIELYMKNDRGELIYNLDFEEAG